MSRLSILVFSFLLFNTLVFAQKTIKHKVVSGESIYSIAKKYDVKENDIYELNPKVKGQLLQLNTVLTIPTNKLKETTKNNTTIASFHEVEANESFYTIAQKYNLSVANLKKFNPDINPNKLQIGTKLNLKKTKIIPEKTENNNSIVIENIEETVYHKVKKGETLSTIAAKYNLGLSVLKKMNPNVSSKIQIGQKLIVKKAIEKPIVVEEPKPKSENIVPVESLEIEDHIEEVDDSGDITHVVVKGETLYSISKIYKVKISKLKALNKSVGDKLSIGHVLLIKKGEIIKPAVVYAEVEDDAVEAPLLSEEGLNKADFLIAKASENIGTRYRSGGKTVGGFDCSGLMCYTFGELEIKLPRTSSEQSKYGVKIKKAKAQKGDLIFFTTNGRGSVNHVGMITEVVEDEIFFIHSSVSRGVIISSTKEAYYARRFVRINRILDKF